MKIFSAGKEVNGAVARNCFLVNQFATPGLGSIMGGRLAAGLSQLSLALAGFVLVLVWFALTMQASYDIAFSNGDGPPKSYAWLGLAGAALFAAAWFWSLITSISLLRQASAEARKNLTAVPPKIGNPPG